ncbi:HupE/UreJ family protein [Peristeroidobacter soli]|uniref:HupE/UreJ family protein n=1 Tax=Peristeroidobacter soli TaxID=2497877 RepID=UPI0013008768|nr:HupE/UreJ family protein [Peristeroidobacter soli]
MLARMSPRTPRLILSSLCALMPATVMAHAGGEAHSFMAGVLHPLLGLDHLVAILAVGLLAGHYGGAMRLWLPTCFVTAMAAGATFGAGSAAQPFTEIGLALSLIAFGLALHSKRSLRATPLIVSTAVFALVHGLAHGTERAGDVSTLPFIFGLILTTATLHAIGVVLARPTLLKWSGRAISLLGIVVLGTLLQS